MNIKRWDGSDNWITEAMNNIRWIINGNWGRASRRRGRCWAVLAYWLNRWNDGWTYVRRGLQDTYQMTWIRILSFWS